MNFQKMVVLMWVFAAISASGFAQAKPQSGLAGSSSVAARRRQQPDWWGHHKKKKQGTVSPNPDRYQNGLGLPLMKHIAGDQKAIWTSPFHLRLRDARWLVPLGGLAAAFFATDTAASRSLATSPTRIHESRTFSNAGAAALIGTAGSLYLLGKIKHNEHMRETGLLSGEAVIDSFMAAEAIKNVAGRERPYVDNAAGNFRQGGNSFPSEHATAVWSTAGILAHEYPGPLTKLFAYGLAAAVSASRVTGQEHFPSDVLVGSVLGYLVAQHVYHAHHNPQVWGDSWQRPGGIPDEDAGRNPANMGSPYVPLDSWVYPAIERLEAMGYVQTAMLGMRPWTRLECARLVQEAASNESSKEKDPPIAARLIANLQDEFANALALLGGARNRSLELQSIYTRFTGIAGQPLNDGYHFGKTITNDFGRPYGEGFNSVTGITGWASSGPFTAYLQGEYQHAPGSAALPLAARQFISNADNLPLEPALATPGVNRFHALNAYVAMNFENWQVSFGKQSLWWGPDQGGPMMFSDNADPMTMLRISRVSPIKLPSIFGWLGPVRAEFFIGRLGGSEFIYHQPPVGLVGQWGVPLSDQPMIQGEKISFKPTPNLEFGFDRTTIFAGAGYPLTFGSFARSMFSLNNTAAGAPNKPGDRRAGFDMTYRLPGLRNWATFYTDSFTDDQFSPVAYFDRSANSAGLYFSHLPKLPNFDLRLEGVYTDVPIAGRTSYLCCGSFYFNDTWRTGYRNDGNLIGSWIGRDGQGEQAWLTYWKSPRSYIRFSYRHQKVSQQFVPHGGTVNDGGVEASLWLGRSLSASAFLQYEKWNFPVLRPGPTSDFTSSIQLTYWPRWRFH